MHKFKYSSVAVASMYEALYTPSLIFHIIAVMIAVGTVTVTDYLHILGIRDPVLERRTLFVFPHLSNLIRIALAAIYITGVLLAIAKPSVLSSPLFWTKVGLVVIVTINGFVLHHKIFPRIEHGIKHSSYPENLIKMAAFGGSLSVVSWYAIVILATTKQLGYSPLLYLAIYCACIAVAYFVAIHMEMKRR